MRLTSESSIISVMCASYLSSCACNPWGETRHQSARLGGLVTGFMILSRKSASPDETLFELRLELSIHSDTYVKIHDLLSPEPQIMEDGTSPRGRCPIAPKLWERLPPELRMQVLGKLPLKSLLIFRAVCSEWKYVIDAGEVVYEGPPGKPVVSFHHPGGILQTGESRSVQRSFLAFPNLKEMSWESITLPFMQSSDDKVESTAKTELVAVDGGLLCFSRKMAVETCFTVYNPLTKRWRDLKPTTLSLSSRATDPYKFCLNGRTYSSILDIVLVGLVVNQETGHYKLIVAGIQKGGGLRSETEVYDSATRIWRRSTPMPSMPKSFEGYAPWYAERGISCGGHVYWHVREDAWTEFHGLLKFDVGMETWTFVKQSTPTPDERSLSFHLQIVSYKEQVFLFEWVPGVYLDHGEYVVSSVVGDLVALGPEVRAGDNGLRDLNQIHFHGCLIPVTVGVSGEEDYTFAFPVGVVSQRDAIFMVFKPSRRWAYDFPLRVRVCGRGAGWLPNCEMIQNFDSLSSFSPTLRAFV
ncbi:hypothetical protein R1flu_025170 [Riccia fluitans]|uniref:F-box domain-containing protein n=1 Tax=Riccia fluitans TaxID=41844 RepID=A0ABD1XWZ2_9MARC